MPAVSGLETVIRRDRAVILLALVVVTALAWLYLIHLANGMNTMPSMVAMTPTWTVTESVLMFVMWAVMMTGMMLPSAAPMILLYGLVTRKQAGRGVFFAPIGVFATGYLVAWTGFSALATALQWLLEQTGLVISMTSGAAPWFAGTVLVVAGIYQWTPLKGSCLTHCRNPMEFLSRSWRRGIGGAVVMGIHHGLYCIGCCWALMLVLFAGGVMNLLLVAGIAALVLIEKIGPFGGRTPYFTGGTAVIAGLGLILFG